MLIATINQGLKQNGDHVLIMTQKELQDMVSVYTEYCSEHKKKKKAAKVLQQFDDELQIY